MLKTILFAAALWLAGTAAPMAQDYPTHTIKIIVPTGVGGITDLLARMVGNRPASFEHILAKKSTTKTSGAATSTGTDTKLPARIK